ncbi:MAG: ATP-binding protein, partial [Bdellovibrionota bacterium]
AQFVLAANGNLCPCGGWPPHLPPPHDHDGGRLPVCRCPVGVRNNYLHRISGPILDRLDLLLLITGKNPRRKPVQRAQVSALQARVEAARATAIRRWGAPPGHLSASDVELLLQENPSWASALESIPLASLRARHKAVRVAMTLSVWDGADSPSWGHFAESGWYRPERFGLTE